MDDLASVVGDAIGVKPAAVRPPPAASGVVTPDQQQPDTFNGSADDLANARAQLAKTKDPAARADLQKVIAQGGTAAATKPTGLSDLGDVVGSAVSSPQPDVPAKTVATPSVAASAAPADQPSALVSGLAGAGKAVGTGALAVQQLVGKGASYVGDVFGSDTLGKVGSWLQQDAKTGVAKLEAENAPYDAANPKSNIAGQVAGAVLSPVNKLVPGFGGAASTLTGAAIKGAGQGAVLNTLTAPVTDDSKPFLQEKLRQGAIGAAGGAVGGALANTIAGGLNKGIQAVQGFANRARVGDPVAAADELVTKTLSAQGIDKSAVPQGLFDGLKTQVQDALASGKQVDPQALSRMSQAQTLPVPVPMLKGQITRDPMQFAKEQNLRGIQGVGEPITDTLQAQNKALIQNLDALGADKGADVVTAGKSAIDALQSADSKAQQVVGNAYQAFKDSTGKSLDVPLQGLSQDYSKTVGEYGDAIPSVIRSKFESLGLLGGSAQKTLSIEDAEGLIKSINKNYDPSNKVGARALNELRSNVQDAIANGAGSNAEGAEAAFLAKSARDAASLRFKQIEATPALKDAINGAQPDKFIQKNILQGNEAHIKNMMDVLSTESPEAASALQDSIMSHIKGVVLNGRTSENGIFSQAQMKKFVTDPNTVARLTQVLGPEKMATLKQLNTVAENALYAPKAAAVNSSNTTSAAANLIKNEVQGGTTNKLLGLAGNIPGLSTAASYAQAGVQSKRASGLIDEAVNPSLGKAAQTTPLSSFAGVGSRAGSAYFQSKSARKSQL